MKIETLDPPFSCFDFVDDLAGGAQTLRRCFSLARAAGCKTLVTEEIPAVGILNEEIEDLKLVRGDYFPDSVIRLSFWTHPFKTLRALETRTSEDLNGYVILKRDMIPSLSYTRNHIFEAVFRKYPHNHNCVPSPQEYCVRIGENEFSVVGVLYAQQNTITTTCAQVAMRTLLSRYLSEADISYRKINSLAASVTKTKFNPASGLNPEQMRAILKHYCIPHRDIDYSSNPSLIKDLPYQKYVYAGVESGAGALLGFQLKSEGGPEDAYHIIPFYGHTFNKDTWTPDAERAYFNIGGSIGYIPSISWTSSFIGHDDNFGPNYCVNRLYIDPNQVSYVAELLPVEYKSSGTEAEAIAMRFLLSVMPEVLESSNTWCQRLIRYANASPPQIVIRAVAASSDRYLLHLNQIYDWEGGTEDTTLTEVLTRVLPPRLWVVEVSLPQLFPANERKLGEIILNAQHPISTTNFDAFMMARLPGAYYFRHNQGAKRPTFLEVPSSIKSHVDVLHSS